MEEAILGTFRNKKDTENIIIYDLVEVNIDNDFEIAVDMLYKNERKLVLLLEDGFKNKPVPYDVDKIEKVPYFVVDNEVYYLEDIFELDADTIDDEDDDDDL